MFHHFPAVDINLDEEREPCLKLDMHEPEIFVLKIKVIIFTLTVCGNKIQQAIILFLRHQSLAVFHYGKCTDQPVFYRVIPEDIQSGLLFRGFGGRKVDKRPVVGAGKCFSIRDDIISDPAGIVRKIFKKNILL